MAAGQRRLVYILETLGPARPSYPGLVRRRFLLFLNHRISDVLLLERPAMRFEQQISACLKSVAVCAVALLLSGSGLVVSASEQAPAAPAPPTPVPAPAAQTPARQTPLTVPGPELQLSVDDAVRMALENNLGIRAERLS